ncbi:MAG: ferritin [Mesoaciditoga sp.]|uniref:ferritin n=1 Tax=Athalassotoga sp. TaxID=2022597 RepID=UPI000CC8E5FB|nr:MAG: ferritin [Mesoaciditoga sp.]HEU23927.1 ferritin [Mesoaciditoga lauensis]
MISKQIEQVLNEQINAEFYSSYLYMAMAAYFRSIKLNGFATWMEKQAKEEEEHALKIYEYLNKRNGRVSLKSVKEPPFEWKSPLDVFEATYVHEQEVTKSIERIVSLTDGEKDYATSSFLQWFIDEQVEEEYSVLQILEKLRMMKDSNQGLLMLDAELGKRNED